ELRQIPRRRSRLPRLRAGGDDSWRLRLRQGIPRRALLAGVADPAHRARQPRVDFEFRGGGGAGAAGVVFNDEECKNALRRSGAMRSIEPGTSRFSGAQLRTRVRVFDAPRNDGERWAGRMTYITGVGLTSYGKHEGLTSFDLMSKAAELAISDAGLKRAEIDGILSGY